MGTGPVVASPKDDDEAWEHMGQEYSHGLGHIFGGWDRGSVREIYKKDPLELHDHDHTLEEDWGHTHPKKLMEVGSDET